ncbi:hypothetical protein ILUMI_03386 [Ignelater luminosus]|uniref:Uncharacterized protein n=1 Tax=Ignelater luminosus TaxID=2038154 RepID=A0A8K0GM81_IGNLU|nr:hypothetical protein ILUMI_03386 [Ignelater luminosus]
MAGLQEPVSSPLVAEGKRIDFLPEEHLSDLEIEVVLAENAQSVVSGNRITITVSSHPKEAKINFDFVWGSTAIGIGKGQAEELFSAIDMPTPSLNFTEIVRYGRYVAKVECANRITKAFTSNLHKLSAAVRKTMQGSGNNSATQLCEDLKYVPQHVFGSHSKCKDGYCRRREMEEENLIPLLESSSILDEIKEIADNVVRKARRLTQNVTTNHAERGAGIKEGEFILYKKRKRHEVDKQEDNDYGLNAAKEDLTNTNLLEERKRS